MGLQSLWGPPSAALFRLLWCAVLGCVCVCAPLPLTPTPDSGGLHPQTRLEDSSQPTLTSPPVTVSGGAAGTPFLPDTGTTHPCTWAADVFPKD